jgi:hypothetical protein
MVTERSKAVLGHKSCQVVKWSTEQCFENHLCPCHQGQLSDDKNVDGS